MPSEETKPVRAERRGLRSAGRPLLSIPVVVLTLAMTGCPKPPIRELVVPAREKAEVLAILNSRADLTKTVLADLSLKVQTATMKHSEKFDGSLAASYPDRLRIRGRHALLDYPPFDLGSDGRTWFLHMHFKDRNEIHLGPAHLLEEYYDPEVPLTPGDLVLALGVGRLVEDPPRRELLFSRWPGYYEIDERVAGQSGRYLAKRIVVDPELMVITRLETYRPDGAADMVAEMGFQPQEKGPASVPTTVRVEMHRKETLQLEFVLKRRRAGVRLPDRVFAVPNTESIPTVYRHESH